MKEKIIRATVVRGEIPRKEKELEKVSREKNLEWKRQERASRRKVNKERREQITNTLHSMAPS